MRVIVTAGPLRAGLDLPTLPGIESFVRPPRGAEFVSTAPCPSCSGSGVATGRRGILTWMSTCPRCRGTGIGQGVLLVRLVAEEGAAEVGQLLTWARDNHARTDVQLIVRNEGGPGWAVRWSGVDQRPLRRWRGYLASREALAVFVDQQHDDVHVALHAVRDDGRVAVAGVWDVHVAGDGTLTRTWSERASRSLAWRRRIRFPAEAIKETARQAQVSRTSASPARDRQRHDQRSPMTTAILTTPTVQVATN